MLELILDSETATAIFAFIGYLVSFAIAFFLSIGIVASAYVRFKRFRRKWKAVQEQDATL